MRAILHLTWRTITHRPARSLATGAGIVIGVALFMAIQTILWAMDVKMSQLNQGEYGSHAVAVLQGRPSWERSADGGSRLIDIAPIPPSAAEKARGIPGVQGVSPRTWLSAHLVVPGDLAEVGVVLADLSMESAVGNVTVVQGRLPTPSETGIMLALPLAQQYAITAGQTVNLILPGNRRVRVMVTGIANDTGLGVVRSGAVVIAPQSMAGRWKIDRPLGEFVVWAKPNVGHEALFSVLEQTLKDEVSVEPPQRSNNYSRAAGPQLLALFGGVGLFVGAFLASNALALTWRRRRREVALLMSVGATARQVVGQLALEAAALGMLAALPGALIGYGLGTISLHTWVAKLSETPLILPPLPVPWATMAAAILLGAVTATLSGVWPAWRMSRVPVVAGLGDGHAARRPTSKVRRLGLLMGHDPRQAAAAGAALMVAMAMVTAFSGVTHSISKATDAQLRSLGGIDLILSGDLPEQTAAAIRRMPGVEEFAVGNILTVVALPDGGSTGEVLKALAVDPKSYSPLVPFSMAPGDPTASVAAFLRGEGVLLASHKAARTGWASGTQLTLKPPGVLVKGAAGLSVPLVGVVQSTWEQPVDLIMPESLGRRVGNALPVIGYLKASRPEVATQVAGRLQQAYPEIRVLTYDEYRQAALEKLRRDWRPFQAILAVAMLVAGLSILITLLAVVVEQRQELAVLRAVGATSGQVGRIVLAQGAVLGLIGSAAGILLGSLLTYAAWSSIAKELGFPFAFPWPYAAYGVVLGTLVAVAASLLAVRRAVKAPVVVELARV